MFSEKESLPPGGKRAVGCSVEKPSPAGEGGSRRLTDEVFLSLNGDSLALPENMFKMSARHSLASFFAFSVTLLR